MKKHFLIALMVLTLIVTVWSQTAPYGNGNANPDLHGTSDIGGGNDDHGFEPSATMNGENEPIDAIFTEDKNELIGGTQNGAANASASAPYGPKTVVYNGTRVYPNGDWCTYYTHVQDLQANPWMGLVTVLEFCCEDMDAQWGPNCTWTVSYRIISSWQGTSGQLSNGDIDAAMASTNAGPGSSGPRTGQTQ